MDCILLSISLTKQLAGWLAGEQAWAEGFSTSAVCVGYLIEDSDWLSLHHHVKASSVFCSFGLVSLAI